MKNSSALNYNAEVSSKLVELLFTISVIPDNYKPYLGWTKTF